ncbi:MAG: coproporphyrinogen dehydrogenase HemZ [Tissierellia bacterium]|nr:coproporphyrinogen dehydrogenase HemZ [Tissierellia bacterium]
MNIKVDNEKIRHVLTEIYRIFNTKDELEFDSNSKNEITEEKVILDSNEEIKYNSKLELKQILYKYFSKKFKAVSPWGILTGTRPLNLMRLKTGKELKNDYFVSDDKIEKLQKIIEIQNKHRYEKDNINLYINIPFCPTRCTYCSFPTIIYKHKDRREEYINSLISEIDGIGVYLRKRNVRTVYFGGGTPTSLETVQMDRIFKKLSEYVNLEKLEEFTVEAGREDTLSEEKLRLMKLYKVSRISVNPQSFKPETLKTIGRKQDNERLVEVFNAAKALGFDINMDLIVGLSGEDENDVENSLERIKELSPENLTIHTLSIKKGSKLSQMDYSLEKERRNIERELIKTFEFTDKNRYFPYYLYRQKEILGNFENIGYAKEGKECIYNIVINEEYESVLGLGMTSNSKIYKNGHLIKYRNPKNIDEYIENIFKIIETKRNILDYV